MPDFLAALAGNAWIQLLVPSAAAGALAGALIRPRKKAILAGAAIPWFGVLAWLLYHEYFVPYAGGGASMWPVALIVGGTFAAITGAMTAGFVNRRRGQPLNEA